MKKYLLFGCIAATIWACGGASEESGSTTESTPKAEPATASVDGEKVYKQYCVTCHGLYGDMGASGAFNLQTSQLSVEERVNVITNGRNAMTPFKALLKPEEIQAVAEYTTTLGG